MTRRFVKRTIDNKNKLFLILLVIAATSGVLAFLLQYFFGGSSVYRDVLRVELRHDIKPVINIYTAGMPIDIVAWSGDGIKIECVAELPVIVETDEFGEEITISQDDGFAVSIFTFAMFRYNMKVYLPEVVEYKELNIISAGGDIDINNYSLITRRVYVETKNAFVNITRPNGAYVVNTKSGDVYMNYDFLVSPAVVESESGNIEIIIPDYDVEKANEMLKIRTGSGSVILTEKDTSLPENYPLL